MKILNRPMFRMGGPIKEGIMNGIQEPRQGYKVSGMVFPGDADRMLPNASKVFANVEKTIMPSTSINQNAMVPNSTFLKPRFNEGMNTTDVIKQFPASIDQNPYRPLSIDALEDRRLKNEMDRVDFERRKIESLENRNTTDKYIMGKDSQSGNEIKILNPDYGKEKYVDKRVVTGTTLPGTSIDDGDLKQGEGINENPSGLETENTPLTKKQKTDNILEMLGYDKAKKNALYDAMINAGQRISRTGLGADNLVSDVIADTSRSYDKPEKLREAANLMRVQQDLKLDQISASKDNRPNEQKLAEYYQSKDGGGYSQEVALRMSRKLPVTMSEYFAASKATSDQGKLYDATRAATDDGKLFGENVDYMGKIDVKKYGNISKFLSSSPADGVYNILGKAIVIKGGDIITEVVVQPKVDSKGWFKKSE